MKRFLVVALLAVVSVVILATTGGCAHVPQKPMTSIDQQREVKFDKRLLKDCEKVTELSSAREEDVQAWIKGVLSSHNSCATLKAKENAEIKKALNIKD